MYQVCIAQASLQYFASDPITGVVPTPTVIKDNKNIADYFEQSSIYTLFKVEK